ncbi:MAG: Rid family detoxifying hydrolase [Aphanocapsa lilacina HA4352-LM1]|nr:Rid family detoxifying hydrolase [Aphanocapsa lilacina HA4352-LM1]
MKALRSENNPYPYSPAVIHGGLVYTAGQIPLVPDSGEVVTGDIEAQTHQTLTNLHNVLKLAGSNLGRVIKVTVFLTDMADFAGLNRVYQTFFTDHLPARSCVAVAALPRGVKVEIEAVAALNESN